MITPELLSEIEERAKAATKRWLFEKISSENGDFSWELNTGKSLIAISEQNYVVRAQAKKDAEFIARMDPLTALALVAEILYWQDRFKAFIAGGDEVHSGLINRIGQLEKELGER